MYNLVLAACVLHNYLRTDDLTSTNEHSYIPPGFVDTNDEENGLWRQDFHSTSLKSMHAIGPNAHSRAAKAMRDQTADYFMKEGQVSWQFEKAGVCNNN